MKLYVVATGNTVECNEEEAKKLVKQRPLSYKLVKEHVKVELEEPVKEEKKPKKTKRKKLKSKK